MTEQQSQAPKAEKAVFKGPGGTSFVPGALVSARTLHNKVKSGKWTPTNAAAKARAKQAAEVVAKQKAAAAKAE